MPVSTVLVLLLAVLTLAIAAAAIVLALIAGRRRRVLADVTASLKTAPTLVAFDPIMLTGLPDPAQRFFLHALAPGTPLSRVVELELLGRMKPRADRPHVEMACEETLAPGVGFVWTARGRMGLPVVVTDHYYRNEGSVRAALFGLVPVMRATGPDVTRSSKGRLAAEAVWCPSGLLLRSDLRWEPVDAERVRLVQTIDGERIDVTLHVDADGRLREVTMLRYGNEGRPDFGLTPYGFAVDEERTFDGRRMAGRLHGGWWYGTERFIEKNASEFVVERATFG